MKKIFKLMILSFLIIFTISCTEETKIEYTSPLVLINDFKKSEISALRKYEEKQLNFRNVMITNLKDDIFYFYEAQEEFYFSAVNRLKCVDFNLTNNNDLHNYIRVDIQADFKYYYDGNLAITLEFNNCEINKKYEPKSYTMEELIALKQSEYLSLYEKTITLEGIIETRSGKKYLMYDTKYVMLRDLNITTIIRNGTRVKVTGLFSEKGSYVADYISVGKIEIL
jgi:hypothetical protein